MIREPFELEGQIIFRPGAAASLRRYAWAEREQTHAWLPGERPDPFYTRFVELAGQGEAVCATMAMNRVPTHIHTDDWSGAGNRSDRWTALICYREGDFSGMEYVLVDYQLAFDLQDGDLLLSRTDLRHGNLPVHGDYQRLSLVMCLENRT